MACSTGRCNPAGLARYNSVLLYDRDGASVGNLRCLSTEKLRAQMLSTWTFNLWKEQNSPNQVTAMARIHQAKELWT